MAEFTKGRKTRTKGVEISRVFVGGQEAAFIFGKGTQLFPNLPVPIWGCLESRVVLDSAQYWFEMGFRVDTELVGNAANGWTDSGNYLRIDTEWSPDLVNWSAGKFVPAPVSVINNGDGTWTYWSRAIHPQNSAVKSGMIVSSSGAAYSGQVGNIVTIDTRNNPFTALTILGVVRALGGFPYTMPTDAARMQTDLAAIFPGATVESSSATVWRIQIPNITFSAFGQLNKVYWPTYLVADMFGVVNTPVDGAPFTGSFVNASGVAIYERGFGRLKFSAGNRYDPYLLP